jgi:hypothetical protein
MPLRPDALLLFRADALRVMEAALVAIRDLEGKCRTTLDRQRAAVAALTNTGRALVAAAYDETDAELLNPESEDIVNLVEEGLGIPDLDDLAKGLVEAFEGPMRALDAAIEVVREIPVPADGMVLVMTDERREREAEREAERSRTRARPRSRSRS